MPTTLGKYQLGTTLGSGVSCKVKLARDSTNQRFAIKLLHDNEEFLSLIKAEVETLKKLSHPNIVNLIEEGNGVMSNSKKQDKSVDYIVLELVNGGDLFDFVCNSGRFSEEVARYYFTQLMDALEYMHNNNCTHRDLKPENIMLDSEFNLKVADFGFAAPVSGRDGTGFLNTQLGTMSYMAPEIHLGKPYTGPGVDLFASAIILFVMLSQRPPFDSANPVDAHYRLLGADRPDLFFQAHDEATGEAIYSADFKDLFTMMTKINPSKRLDMSQIRAHAWMQGSKPSKNQIRQEFENRKKQVDAEANAEKDSKREERAQRNYDRTAHRGNEAMTEEERATFEDDMEAFKEIELEDFEEVIPKFTAFFTTAKVVNVVADLHKLLTEDEQYKIKPVLDSDKGKMKFVLEGANPVKITVKFTKVDDQKTCVEFNRRSGDHFVFLTQYKKIIQSDLMKVYNDDVFSGE